MALNLFNFNEKRRKTEVMILDLSSLVLHKKSSITNLVVKIDPSLKHDSYVNPVVKPPS